MAGQFKKVYSFNAEILQGRTPEMTAMLRMSARVIFSSTRIRKTAERFRLTLRETEILILLMRGFPACQMDEKIGTKRRTVYALRHAIYAKMGVTNDMAALLKFILAMGVVVEKEDEDLLGLVPEEAQRIREDPLCISAVP